MDALAFEYASTRRGVGPAGMGLKGAKPASTRRLFVGLQTYTAFTEQAVEPERPTSLGGLPLSM